VARNGWSLIVTYIYHHSSSYIFRIAIPSDIIPHFKKTEIRYSLKTGSLSIAKFRSKVIVSKIQRLYDEVICNVDWDKQIDLSHLKESEFVV
jgi:Domain of unknown function (DUF6538)